jgi:hypothetical protein
MPLLDLGRVRPCPDYALGRHPTVSNKSHAPSVAIFWRPHRPDRTQQPAEKAASIAPTIPSAVVMMTPLIVARHDELCHKTDDQAE